MGAVKLSPLPWYFGEDKWNGGYSGIFAANNDDVMVPQHRNDGDFGAAWFEEISDVDRDHLLTAVNAHADLVAALEAVEWVSGWTTLADICPICQRYKHNGHAGDCQLAAALAKGRAE